MDLIQQLYGQEDISLREIWKRRGFDLFSPNVAFLGHKQVSKAIREKDSSFFVNHVMNNFFPDKTIEEVKEAKRNAINRGINALNRLCSENLPEIVHYLKIEQIPVPYNPLEAMAQARSKWLESRNGINVRSERAQKMLAEGIGVHAGLKNPRALLEAYEVVRAWGLGHLVLVLDESPEIFHSVHHQVAVDTWFSNQFQFANPQPNSDNTISWETKPGIKVIGTRFFPFRRRAKIYDDQGNINYSSLLMKMFLKDGFVDRINDTFGVEFVVESKKEVGDLIHYFRSGIRGATSLEKYQHVTKEDPPFECEKFIMRIPIKVTKEKPVPFRPLKDDDDCITIERPLEKYIRVPVEVQIRAVQQQIDHSKYKKQQYTSVFPLWYPREIYESVLRNVKF